MSALVQRFHPGIFSERNHYRTTEKIFVFQVIDNAAYILDFPADAGQLGNMHP